MFCIVVRTKTFITKCIAIALRSFAPQKCSGKFLKNY
jgi:hypothetical protein